MRLLVTRGFRHRLLYLYVPLLAIILLAIPLFILVQAWRDDAPNVQVTPGRVVLDGPIHPRTAPQFLWALDRVHALTPPGGEVVVELNSPGGVLPAAEVIAWGLHRFERLHPVRTVVPRGAACQSACTVVFLGANRREADPTAHFMFHLPDAPPEANGLTRWLVRTAERVFRDYARRLEDASPRLVRYLVQEGVFFYRADCHLTGAEIGGSFPELLRVRPIPPTLDIAPEQTAVSRLMLTHRRTCADLGGAAPHILQNAAG